MRKRHIIFGLLLAIGVASVALLAYMPSFTPPGTVEIRSIETES